MADHWKLYPSNLAGFQKRATLPGPSEACFGFLAKDVFTVVFRREVPVEPNFRSSTSPDLQRCRCVFCKIGNQNPTVPSGVSHSQIDLARCKHMFFQFAFDHLWLGGRFITASANERAGKQKTGETKQQIPL